MCGAAGGGGDGKTPLGRAFLDLARTRQSTRRYRDRPVQRESIERCLEAARLAPSACNAQPWKFVVVQDAQIRRRLAGAAVGPFGSFNTFVHQAPVLVAVVASPPDLKLAVGGALKRRDYSLIDSGIAAGHFCLQAAELGLGSCMLGWFDEGKVKSALGVPRNHRVHLLIALGYAADPGVREKRRRPLPELYSYDRYR
jgi:nitroreductase